jgi:hypothetical protein
LTAPCGAESLRGAAALRRLRRFCGMMSSILNDITVLRKFRGSSSLKPKPILRIGIKSILRIDTDMRAALASQFSKT